MSLAFRLNCDVNWVHDSYLMRDSGIISHMFFFAYIVLHHFATSSHQSGNPLLAIRKPNSMQTVGFPVLHPAARIAKNCGQEFNLARIERCSV